MKKSKVILIIVAAVLALALVALLSAVLKSEASVTCPDCNGDGTVFRLACNCGGEEDCDLCGGAGGLEAEECGLCGGSGTVIADSWYYSTFMALVPPIIAIALALITKEVYSSLLIGVVAGGVLYANFNPVSAAVAVVRDGLISAVSDTSGIFIFLIILGILVVLVNRAGGSAAFGRWAERNIKTKAGAMLATFALGVLIFIDDYFNCLTVGSVMKPVTDSHKISRVKLAYLIDATAAPVCMIAPISSWAAAVSEYVENGQGLKYFILAIPYNFYSLLTLVFIIAITLMGFDYGKMSGYEIRARGRELARGDVSEKADKDSAAESNPRGRVFDLLVPILLLLVFCIAAILYSGGFFGGDYAGNISGAFGNTDVTEALPLGSGVALVFIMFYLIFRRLISFKEAMKAVPRGFMAMVPAILILTLATALKNMTGLLGAKYYVAGLLEDASALMAFLPAIIFLVACGLAFATGTSWGTFGILIPIVSTGIGLDTELGIIAMSACLAGAVCGDHCSPISDTTIMASAGAECNHVEHVSTQLPYAVTVAAISFVSFIIAGFVQNWLITLPVSIAMTIGVLFVIRAIAKKKQA